MVTFTISHFREGHHILSLAKADACIHRGAAHGGGQVKYGNFRRWIAGGENMDRFHMIGAGHGAFHHDTHRHGIAIFRNRRKPERYATLLRSAPGTELINRGLHLIRQIREARARHQRHPDERQRQHGTAR